MFKDLYQLEIPLEIKVHFAFYVLLKKPFKEHTLWPDCKQVIWPPPYLVGDHLEYEVEGILKCKNSQARRKTLGKCQGGSGALWKN